MYTNINLLLVFLNSLTFLISVCTSQSCTQYAQSSTAVTFICTHGAKKFPNTTKSVQKIQCLDCNIPILDENMINNFQGETFKLSDSHVKTIGTNAFSRFTSAVQRFIFENNEISFIAPKVFSKFSSLKEINLRNNSIFQLAPRLFENTNIAMLDLSQNHLSKVNEVFGGMEAKNLNLSFNEIKEIPANAFDSMIISSVKRTAKSHYLDFSNNIIKKIYPTAFKFRNDACIYFMYLQNNSLCAIESNTFLELHCLNVLSLEDNYISQLHRNSFKGLRKLQDLNLKNNRISVIPTGLFADLTKLVVLDLSKNIITELNSNTFSGLQILSELNMSHNHLQVIKYSDLIPVGKLMSLDVSDTRLHNFEAIPFLENEYSDLYRLVINDNFWTCNNLAQMLRHMQKHRIEYPYAFLRFNVPNINGIACSTEELHSYHNLSIEDFLNIISKEKMDGDVFELKFDNDYDIDIDIDSISKGIYSINCMFVIITTIGVIVTGAIILKYFVLFLKRFNNTPM